MKTEETNVPTAEEIHDSQQFAAIIASEAFRKFCEVNKLRPLEAVVRAVNLFLHLTSGECTTLFCDVTPEREIALRKIAAALEISLEQLIDLRLNPDLIATELNLKIDKKPLN